MAVLLWQHGPAAGLEHVGECSGRESRTATQVELNQVLVPGQSAEKKEERVKCHKITVGAAGIIISP